MHSWTNSGELDNVKPAIVAGFALSLESVNGVLSKYGPVEKCDAEGRKVEYGARWSAGSGFEVHLAQERQVARVRADGIEKRIALDRHDHWVTRVDSPFHPGEGAIRISESEVEPREASRRHIGYAGHFVKALEHGPRPGRVPGLC